MILLTGFSSDVKLFPTTLHVYFQRDVFTKDFLKPKSPIFVTFPLFFFFFSNSVLSAHDHSINVCIQKQQFGTRMHIASASGQGVCRKQYRRTHSASELRANIRRIFETLTCRCEAKSPRAFSLYQLACNDPSRRVSWQFEWSMFDEKCRIGV